MPLDPTQPFTRAQALAAGLTDRVLGGPRFQRLLDGVYLSSNVPATHEHRARAALLVAPPTACLSHTSVARLLGAPVAHDPDEHLTVPDAGQRIRRQGVRCHVAALERHEQGLLRGLRVTSATRLFLDLAAVLPLVDLVVLGDWLVRQGHVTVLDLRERCGRGRGRGAADAREAAGHVRERVDSPMETRLRMLLVLAGLPEPVVNAELRDDFGSVVFRLDLSYPSAKVAVEYDGRHHVDVRHQWERDLRRREALEAQGWRVIVVTSKDLFVQPGETVARVRDALVSRGLRVPATRDTWRRHFAGRAA